MFSEATMLLWADAVPEPTTHGAPQGEENTDQAPTPPSAPTETGRKRPRALPTDLDDMVDTSFACCKRLRCVEAFVTGQGNVRELRAEQTIIKGLTGTSKSDFVNGQVPVTRPGKNEGALYAGGRLVCNSFFKRAFGVSNNMIQNRLNNPGSAIAKRYVCVYVAVSFCVYLRGSWGGCTSH